MILQQAGECSCLEEVTFCGLPRNYLALLTQLEYEFVVLDVVG